MLKTFLCIFQNLIFAMTLKTNTYLICPYTYLILLLLQIELIIKKKLILFMQNFTYVTSKVLALLSHVILLRSLKH